MKKPVRIALYAIGGLLALAMVALSVLLVIVDGNFVKARMENAMKAKNRTLVIEGEPKLRLFPIADLALGKTTLSEPGSDKVFVALDAAEIAVRTLALLSGEVAVETLKLSGLKANVVRRKDGTMNFSDLVEPKGKDRKSEEPPTLRIAEVSVEKVQIAYRDEATGQELNVAELNLKTGRLDGQTPGDLALTARFTGKKPEVDLRAQAAGASKRCCCANTASTNGTRC